MISYNSIKEKGNKILIAGLVAAALWGYDQRIKREGPYESEQRTANVEIIELKPSDFDLERIVMESDNEREKNPGIIINKEKHNEQGGPKPEVITSYDQIRSDVESVYTAITGQKLPEMNVIFSLDKLKRKDGRYNDGMCEIRDGNIVVYISPRKSKEEAIRCMGHEIGHGLSLLFKYDLLSEETAYAMQAAFEKEMCNRGLLEDYECSVFWPTPRNILCRILTSTFNKKHEKAKSFVRKKIGEGIDPYELYLRTTSGDIKTKNYWC